MILSATIFKNKEYVECQSGIEDEFNRKIARNINNPEKIGEDFNSDRNSLANFSLKEKDKKGFSLRIKDPFGNESSLRVNYEE